LARKLLVAEPDIAISISYTTRPIRPGEVDGQDYHFVDDAEFQHLVDNNAFLEYATVFDHRYATPAQPVQDSLARGQDVLFDIDWQGTQQIAQKMRDDLVPIFVLPPSVATLRSRLEARGTDSVDVINGRMDRAIAEISHWIEYDYVLINDDLEQCFRQVQTILESERLRRQRQTGITDFVRQLMQK